MLDALSQLNQRQLAEVGDPDTQTRIEQYEMAFRMQSSVPELLNLNDEPQHVRNLYGPEVARPGSFAASCLLARRLAEPAVRFTQIFHRAGDHHGNPVPDLPIQCPLRPHTSY